MPSVPTLRRGDDQVEFVPQPLRQLVNVRTAIRINDDRNGQHAGVRESLEVDSHASALPHSDRDGCVHLAPAKHDRLDRSADVCYERVESALVVHVIPVAAKPGDQAEQPAKNGDGRLTASGSPMLEESKVTLLRAEMRTFGRF